MINVKTVCKTLLVFVLAVSIGACTTYDVMQNKAIKIDGEVYYYNKTGEIELTEEQLNDLSSDEKIVRIKHVAPTGALIIDPEELTVLMQDREVFYSELDNENPNGRISVLVRKGSLRENLERLIKDEGWAKVTWNPPVDFYVPKPFAIVGEDIPSVVIEVLAGYPVYVSFNDIEKSISVMEKITNQESPTEVIIDSLEYEKSKNQGA